VVETDSAGVAIVESAAPQWAGTEPPWRIDTLPRVDVGAGRLGPDYEFYRVKDVAQLSDGSLAVADYGSHAVRFYSSAGEFLGSFGGSGRGPGEFQLPMKVEPYLGDSVVVYDPGQLRVTVIGPGRTLGRTVTLFGVNVGLDLLVAPDGAFLVPSTVLDGRESRRGRIRPPQALLRYSANGTALDSVLLVAGTEEFILEDGSRATPPLRKASVLELHGGVLYVGDAETLGYSMFDLTGRLLRVIRAPAFPLDLDDQRRAALKDSTRECCYPSDLQQMVDAMEVPHRMPAYQQILVDASGFVWLAGFQPLNQRDLPVVWQVFSPEGAWLGALTTPARFEALQIGGDYVLGVRRDEMDVERVQVLGLSR
jgi:hypothetical protein